MIEPLTVDEAWARPGVRARIAMAALAVAAALLIFAVVGAVWKSGATIRTAMQAAAPSTPMPTTTSTSASVEVSLVPTPARPASGAGASR
ncbi:MAG: hypothetical protein ABI281_13075 [Caldimonas sp.]